MADQGAGVSLAFDSSFFASVESLDWSGWSRESIETTTLGTTTARTFEPSDLYDPGQLSLEGLAAPGSAPHVAGSAAETATVTFSNSDASTWAATGFMVDYGVSVGNAIERVMYAAELKLSGAITVVL